MDKQDLRTQSNCVQPGGSNDELWASSEFGAGCCGSQAATSSMQAFGPSQAMPGSCGAGNGMRGVRADDEELNPRPARVERERKTRGSVAELNL